MLLFSRREQASNKGVAPCAHARLTPKHAKSIVSSKKPGEYEAAATAPLILKLLSSLLTQSILQHISSFFSVVRSPRILVSFSCPWRKGEKLKYGCSVYFFPLLSTTNNFIFPLAVRKHPCFAFVLKHHLIALHVVESRLA